MIPRRHVGVELLLPERRSGVAEADPQVQDVAFRPFTDGETRDPGGEAVAFPFGLRSGLVRLPEVAQGQAEAILAASPLTAGSLLLCPPACPRPSLPGCRAPPPLEAPPVALGRPMARTGSNHGSILGTVDVAPVTTSANHDWPTAVGALEQACGFFQGTSAPGPLRDRRRSADGTYGRGSIQGTVIGGLAQWR